LWARFKKDTAQGAPCRSPAGLTCRSTDAAFYLVEHNRSLGGSKADSPTEFGP